MDQITLLGDIVRSQEWQDWATEEMERQQKRILKLEKRLLDTYKITTHEIDRLRRESADQLLLVTAQRKRILELEDQLLRADTIRTYWFKKAVYLEEMLAHAATGKEINVQDQM